MNYFRNFKHMFGTIFYKNVTVSTNNQFIVSKNRYKLKILSVILLGYSVHKCYNYKRYVSNDSNAVILTDKIVEEKANLPYYTFQDIAKHSTKEERIWVTFQKGVYDITDFVPEHPGGDQILMAAGNSVDPFWNLYSVHYNRHVLEILEKYRIGNLKEENHSMNDLTDPYASDPKRHPCLKVASAKPFNAETPESLLITSFYTPNEFFYVRNHLPVPVIDADDYVLEVEVEGTKKTITLTLEELKKISKSDINATVMCAGNRRSEMMKVKPVKGLNWGPCAVGNAKWSGVMLRDILKLVGIDDDYDGDLKHVHFEAYDTDVTNTSYGASIPLSKAVDKKGDVLLAYEMNDVEIPRDHGFPVRVIVPGVVGARNVKWLAKIIVSSKESDSHWQQNDYKGFSPAVDYSNVDYSKSPAIQDLPVISAICEAKIINGYVSLKGYAWSGSGQKIVRVDVGVDDGKKWYVADFDHQDPAPPPRHWSWTLWSCKVPIPENTRTMDICVKAVDSCYNTQPEKFEHIWNLRGVLNNAYHKITLQIK